MAGRGRIDGRGDRRMRLIADPQIRAMLPSVPTITTVGLVAGIICVALYATAFALPRGPARFALGVVAQWPTLLVATLLAGRLVRRLPDAPGVRTWRAMLAALIFANVGVLSLAASGFGGTLVVIFEWLSVPAATACFLMATLMRRRSASRGPALFGIFDLVVVGAVIAAYAGFFLSGPILTTGSSNVLLAGFITLATVVLLGVTLRMARVDERGITVEALFAVGMGASGAIALVSTLAYVSRPGGTPTDAIWLPGLAWAVVWGIGIAMPYAELYDTGIPTAPVHVGRTRRLWPYAVLLVMPPLAIAGIVADLMIQKIAAVVGFLVVVEILVARQFLLIGEQRAASVRRADLTETAQLEALRAEGLLAASLELSRTDDIAEMCAIVAGHALASLPHAVSAFVVVDTPGGAQAGWAGNALAGVDAESEHGAVERAPVPDAVLLDGALQLLNARVGLTGDSVRPPLPAPVPLVGPVPAGAGLHLVAVRDATDAVVGSIGVVADAEAGSAEVGELVAGFADQLALSLGRAWLVADLRDDGARIRSIVDNMPDAIAELDTTGRVHAANAGFASIFGDEPAGLLGRTVPIERIRMERLDELVSRALLGDDDGELGLDDAAGNRRLFEYAVVRYLTDGADADDGRDDEPVRLLLVLHDETERREQAERVLSLYRDLADEERSRTELLEKVIASAENERRRLAHELHDGPVQTMTALGLRLDAAKALGELGGDGSRRGDVLADEVRGDVAGLVASLRAFMTALRPPVLDERGVGKAVEVLAHRIEHDTGLHVRTNIRKLPVLAEALQTLLYRVAQEALGNVARHAAATEVTISFAENDSGEAVELEIADDGIGCGPFDAAAFAALTAGGRVGLAALAERMALAGGRLRVVPGDTRGTRVIAVLPVSRW